MYSLRIKSDYNLQNSKLEYIFLFDDSSIYNFHNLYKFILKYIFYTTRLSLSRNILSKRIKVVRIDKAR